VELRTLETVPAMVLLALVTFVIFHFGLNRNAIAGQLAAGVLTVTLLFAAMLGINRLFVAEREQGGFDAVLLAPVDRTAMLLAKATALFLFLAVLELAAVPAFALFLLGPSLGPGLAGLILVLLLADAGLAVIGTVVSAIAIHTRARDLIGPVIALPLLIPALIAPIAGFMASYAFSPKYTSQSTVLVEGQVVPDNYVQPVITADFTQRVQTLSQEVLSPSRLRPVIQNLGLASKPEDESKIMSDIQQNFQVEPVITSMSAAASFKISCCACMSSVWNVGRVNMSSHANETLFAMSGASSTGFWVPTMAQIFPCGLMSGANAGKYWSVLLRQKT